MTPRRPPLELVAVCPQTIPSTIREKTDTMTPDRLEELEAIVLEMRTRINHWCVYDGKGRTKKSADTMISMLNAGQVAETLLEELRNECIEGLMLRSAYLDAVNGTLTELH